MAGLPGTRLAPDLPPGPRAALVIATTSYEDPELGQLRAPAHDAQDLAEVLADPGIGGFAVTTVIDADERQARRAIDEFLAGRGVRDVAVVYLSCHGVLDRRNRLYFAAANTVKTQLSVTGIPAGWLREELEECRARQQVLILDCCFSGAFAHGSKGDTDLDLERRLAVPGRGQVVLTASRAGEYSFEGQALPGAAVSGSVFTAGLVEGLRTGAADAGGDGYVSVDEAYEYAYRYVQSSGASQTPQRWLSGGEGPIMLARSPAGIAIIPATLPEDLAASLDSRYPAVRIGVVHELGGWLAGGDPARAVTAEQKLREIADTDNPAVAAVARDYLGSLDQSAALTGSGVHSVAKDETTAGTAAEVDPEGVRSWQARATRVLADVGETAWSIPDPVAEDETIASTAAEADLEHIRSGQARAVRLLADAEDIAQSITDEFAKARALRGVAVAVATIDPDRAERIVRSITDAFAKAWALCEVAAAVVATDPDRAARLLTDAENIAQSMPLALKVSVLSDVGVAVAAIDPDRAARLLTAAENIARSPADDLSEAMGLHAVAVAVAAIDPDRAERIARSITGKDEKASALRDVAVAVAATDPDRAERIAESITGKDAKAWVLCEVAAAVAATDLDRAARLLTDAENIVRSITDEEEKALALCGVAVAVATIDPDRAECIVRSITDEDEKALALRDVAVAVAATDPDRAERIAQSITGKDEKARALRDIAVAVAATDPDRAERIAGAITGKDAKSKVLRKVAAAVAATDPDRAERIAQSITGKDEKAWALGNAAVAVAATDPDRAERIAGAITDPEAKASALCKIVNA